MCPKTFEPGTAKKTRLAHTCTFTIALLCSLFWHHCQAFETDQSDTIVFDIYSIPDMSRLLTMDPTQDTDIAITAEIKRITPNFATPSLSGSLEISQQPVPASINKGDNLTLNVSTPSSDTASYLWRRNGVVINGAVQPSLTIDNATPDHNGWYMVQIFDTGFGRFGVTVSDVVLVTVNPGESGQPVTAPDSSGPTGTGTALLTWTTPTERTDGTPLSSSEIAGYRVYQGSNSRGWFRNYYISDLSQTTFWLDTLPVDLHYFSVTAVDKYGQESEPTEIGYKRIEATQPLGDS